ncbi:motile sperm domain-containing protein 1 isoform X1 [Eurytemora carolleeae]|uniref:motile sperm domain-containing protein 1 isoform X1 n=1 Tax=Eurytemora carolleeae TaxID=1294199 RepID=UPI000C78C8B7|nr:motile sperm domain-containing protein 1 isoform X1 [Eurytemora carolleeae]|eukprot:XP_023325925.1 motile sperm domain-containing protein 1-like isoform X1 [Eurytemora affinis]
MSSSSTSIMDGRIPVFVFPVQLDFYYDDQTTHKRVVTIYNPYEFDVTFKVLCNNPKKYAVVEPEGRISGQKCVDIVIRHVAVSPQSVETTDKFRIHMFEEGTSEILGKKDVLAILHPGLPEAESASLGNKQRKSQPGFPLLKSDGDSPPRDVPVPNFFLSQIFLFPIIFLFYMFLFPTIFLFYRCSCSQFFSCFRCSCSQLYSCFIFLFPTIFLF